MNNDIFQQRFAKLNPAQKQAVETIFGPVMVIAGPGTGKTEILAARIANILQNPEAGAEAQNILCLTYTDAGTIAMRKRLTEFIGPLAHKVHIHTFHSFCNDIIQQNVDLFSHRELQALSDLEKIGIIQEIVDAIPADHILFQKMNTNMIPRLQNLFETMKAENWSVQDIQNAVDTYINDLPNREDFRYKRKYKEFQAGDLNPKKIEAETQKIERLKKAAELFDQYQSKLQEAGRYDYQDMILWVLKAFESNETLLARYQEQFQYILVDEYQDTNGTQNALLQKLCEFWDDPNIFIVGDDDQSIYRFQGANLRNIMDFYHQYQEHINIVVLTDNYRSSQNILDVSRGLIERNHERLTKEIPNLEKSLTAKNADYADSEVRVEITEYPNPIHESADIVKHIEKLQQEGIDLSEVAVIYSQHRQAANIIKVLEQKKIPLSVKESVNVLEQPFIQSIITLLRYLAAELELSYSGEHFLFHLLHSEIFDVSTQDTARLAAGIRIMKREKQETQYWRNILADTTQLESFGVQSSEKYVQIQKRIENCLKIIHNHTLQEAIEKVFSEMDIINFIISSEEQHWYMRLLTSFFNFIKEESYKNPKLTISEFLSTIDQMQEHRLSLKLQKILSAKNGVNFVTAHSSKGLEFKYVFLIGAQKDTWDKKGNNRGNFSYPDTLTRSNDGDETQERRRLFFVALTRAKEHLHISYAVENENDKAQEYSQFVSEIMESPYVHTEQKSCSDEVVTTFQLQTMQSIHNENNQHLLESSVLDELLKNYRLSATHLNKYLRCPRQFYFENVLRIPAALNTPMGFGNAMHYGLEQFFNQKSENKEELINFFKRGMQYYAASFTDKDFDRYLGHGEKVLSALFNHYYNTWKRDVRTEYQVFTALNDVPINGKLDKLEFLEDGTINVVDYKTGNPENPKSKAALNPPNAEVNPLGGDYWRQIVFYKILLDNEGKYIMSSGEMDFIEPVKDEFIKKNIIVQSQDIELVSQQIEEVYTKIMNHEFDAGCGECEWCQNF